MQNNYKEFERFRKIWRNWSDKDGKGPCHECPAHWSCRDDIGPAGIRPDFGDGHPNATIAIVGQDPGGNDPGSEDYTQRSFDYVYQPTLTSEVDDWTKKQTEPIGELFTKLEQYGESVFWTQAKHCDEINSSSEGYDPKNYDAIINCSKNVREELELVDPDVVVTLGLLTTTQIFHLFGPDNLPWAEKFGKTMRDSLESVQDNNSIRPLYQYTESHPDDYDTIGPWKAANEDFDIVPIYHFSVRNNPYSYLSVEANQKGKKEYYHNVAVEIIDYISS